MREFLGTELREASRGVLMQLLRANNAATRDVAAGLERRHGGGEGVHAGADGAHTPAQRQALIQGSLVAGVYEQTVDRESAHERLKGGGQGGRAATDAGRDAAAGSGVGTGTGTGTPAPANDDGGLFGGLKDLLFGSTGPRGGRRPGLAEAAVTSAVRTMGSTVGREIIRGVLGSILGGSSSRRPR